MFLKSSFQQNHHISTTIARIPLFVEDLDSWSYGGLFELDATNSRLDFWFLKIGRKHDEFQRQR